MRRTPELPGIRHVNSKGYVDVISSEAKVPVMGLEALHIRTLAAGGRQALPIGDILRKGIAIVGRSSSVKSRAMT